jgi:hypothetical protein
VLLAVYCMVALGTNVFDMYYVGHLFWIVLGLIDSAPIQRRVTGRGFKPVAGRLARESS